MIPADMRVTGRFDDAFAAGARPIIEKLARESRDITVDMSEAADIDAAGLGTLVYLHKRLAPLGCKVRVLGANGNHLRLFETYQIADLFIEGAAKAANTALRTCFFGVQPPARASSSVPANSSVVWRERKLEASRDGGIQQPAIEPAPLADAKQSVRAWLDIATIPGSALRGGDALKSYKRWAGKVANDFNATILRRALAGILGADRVVSRTSGYVVQGIQLSRYAKAAAH